MHQSAHYMLQALTLARRGQGLVEPNPMVGAVLVRSDGEIVADGWHECFGGPHAEIVCFEHAKKNKIDVSQCELFVTLEPCCHHGKTPPCLEALLAARPRRVHIAMKDPFPKVNGRSIARLREAGVEVAVDVCLPHARELNAPYLKRIQTGAPWVIAKWAQTLDGRVASKTGDSQWISSDESRARVHELRSRVDAVIVGVGTVLSDNPQLTARDVEIKRKARRIVIDPNWKTPLGAKLIKADRSADAPPVMLAVDESVLNQRTKDRRAFEKKGVEFFTLATPKQPESPRLLAPLLKHLVENHEATNVLIEGGPVLFGHLFREQLIDQVLAFVAPKLLGAAQARSAVEGLTEALTIDQSMKLAFHTVEPVGQDVLLDYRPTYR